MGINTPAFELRQGVPSDLDAMMYILSAAWKDDSIWKYLVRDVSDEGEHKFLCDIFGKRFKLPDSTFYKITEVETGKTVAWTSLAHPCALTPEQKAFEAELPEVPEGVNMELLGEFFGMIDAAHKYGYDPEKEYHRKGTMVHPEYQKRGFGRQLTRHCNEQADKTGGKTWVGVRPSSKKMFTTLGFKEVDYVPIDMKKYGGDEGDYWMMLREPQPS